MKIVYCLDQIESIGGVERITIAKANSLSQIQGNEVYIVLAYLRKKTSLPIHPNVSIIDLDVRYYDDIKYNKYGRLMFMFKKRNEHKRKMENCLNLIKPDIVISPGWSEKYFITKLHICSCPIYIREYHVYKLYRRLLAKNFLERTIAYIREIVDSAYSRGVDKIVVLTNEDKQNWRNKDVVVIPNPITSIPSRISTQDNKIVIAAGRLAEQKNFGSLLVAWKMVHYRFPDWELRIYGEGEQKGYLKSFIDTNGLSGSIRLFSFTNNILDEMTKSSVFVLSSIYEGLPLVIIEAMACGLPVVSYACPCGPKDIIEDGKDGFIVPVNDERALADRICFLMRNEYKRKEMGQNAIKKSKFFLMEVITEKWMSLFKELLKEKKGIG